MPCFSFTFSPASSQAASAEATAARSAAGSGGCATGRLGEALDDRPRGAELAQQRPCDSLSVGHARDAPDGEPRDLVTVGAPHAVLLPVGHGDRRDGRVVAVSWRDGVAPDDAEAAGRGRNGDERAAAVSAGGHPMIFGTKDRKSV